MPKKPTSIRKGAALVKKWSPRFGLSHYKQIVAGFKDYGEAENFGESFYDHQEEWYQITLPPDAELDDAQREMLVLHELAHGLIEYATTGEGPLETACNRIARLALGNLNADGPRYHHCRKEWAKQAAENV